jgi:ATP-dependent helicase YprA (DUF1998 family)
VLIASSAPLDQYIVEHPDYFFGASVEEAHINPNNLEIFLNHLNVQPSNFPFAMANHSADRTSRGFAVFWPKIYSFFTARATLGIG